MRRFMAYYNREFRVFSDFVDSVLYSGFIFEGYSDDEAMKLFARGCVRYDDDRSGKQCKADIIEYINKFIDKNGAWSKYRYELTDTKDDDRNEDGTKKRYDFEKYSREYDSDYDDVYTSDSRIIYILKKYLHDKFNDKSDNINGSDSDIKKFVNFVKNEIIKGEVEKDRDTSKREFKKSGVYDMDKGVGKWGRPTQMKLYGKNQNTLDALVAEEKNKYNNSVTEGVNSNDHESVFDPEYIADVDRMCQSFRDHVARYNLRVNEVDVGLARAYLYQTFPKASDNKIFTALCTLYPVND